MLSVWQRRGQLPPWLTDGVVWQLLALSQQVWALVLMALTLLMAARHLGRQRDGAEDGATVAVLLQGHDHLAGGRAIT